MTDMDKKSDQPLAILIGRELSSVEFVRDYIQIRFDGPCLTAVTDPFVVVENNVYNRTTPGFCDMILGLIGLQVEDTSVIEGEAIEIHFSSGRSFNISLKPDEYITVEAAKFDDGFGKWWIW